MTSLLEVEGLSKSFGRGSHRRPVLDSFEMVVAEGAVVGLVGESGAGKSTAIRCLVGLETPDAGSIRYDGEELVGAPRAVLRRYMREMQMVFQDPYSSLDPRRTIERIVGEALDINEPRLGRKRRRERVVDALEHVGLGAPALDRYPRSFSGGQRQRIAIARALVMRPRLLICDEPVSALDVSVQAQIVALLQSLQRELVMSVVFVAHDLALVRHLCDEICVLEQGRIVDAGATETVFQRPSAGYTRELIGAVPVPMPPALREAAPAATSFQSSADPAIPAGGKAQP
ncbi:ABC transporter ATP-binding protein [Microbacterium lacus]|uniref:ATP-binding cassette domain-containing protein n=1 Tax=Microbacterium lacus TaxID=415217 RepID=UPI00384D4450